MKDMATKLTLLPVSKNTVDVVWPAASAELAKAVPTAAGKFLISDIYDGIMNDTYVLWVVLDEAEVVAAITTRIVQYPQRRTLAIDWIGGRRMTEWLPTLVRAMKEHAHKNKCTALEGYGRRAWGRWLARYGWEPDYIAYKMELDDVGR